jgi:carotenoid cleavage dioxygenase-like enzyme
MHAINQKQTRNSWELAISQPAKEFPRTPLPTIVGNIPEGLRGTLYRNGPARLERGKMRMGHWFDGDGAILAVDFTDRCVNAVYRYVQTKGYQEEEAANQLLYGNYGTIAPGKVWQRRQKLVKNVANTSVLALPDKLLALWEGGKPYAMNLQTLETRGEDDLGELSDGLSYCAHYKRDAQTGEIFNFGISAGLNAKLNIYKSTASGRIVQKASHSLNGVPLVHDFVLAGQYLVFMIPPVRLNVLPVLTGSKSYSEALEWQPSKGTQILVIDRQTLKIVSRSETEPWFQWHFANGYVDDSGEVIVDIARYEDFQTNKYLQEVANGETHTVAQSSLSRVHLNPATGKVSKIRQILDRHCEFPSVPAHNVGKASQFTYLSTFGEGTDVGKELLNAIARYDHKTESLTEAFFGQHRYPSEPIYAPDPNNPERGWVLTVVYDGKADSSEVWIFDSEQLDSEPLCKLELPSVIPHSFHGTWKGVG